MAIACEEVIIEFFEKESMIYERVQARACTLNHSHHGGGDPMSEYFSVETRNECVVITLEKRDGLKSIDMVTVASIKSDLLEAITSDMRVVVLDLTNLVAISSSMVGVIIAIKNSRSATRFRCVITEKSAVERVFQTSRVNRIIDCHTSLTEALAAEQGAQ